MHDAKAMVEGEQGVVGSGTLRRAFVLLEGDVAVVRSLTGFSVLLATSRMSCSGQRQEMETLFCYVYF